MPKVPKWPGSAMSPKAMPRTDLRVNGYAYAIANTSCRDELCLPTMLCCPRRQGTEIQDIQPKSAYPDTIDLSWHCRVLVLLTTRDARSCQHVTIRSRRDEDMLCKLPLLINHHRTTNSHPRQAYIRRSRLPIQVLEMTTILPMAIVIVSSIVSLGGYWEACLT